MLNPMNAQSEIARRQAFVSSGMQDARLLSWLVSNLLRRFRERLVKAVSDHLVSQSRQRPNSSFGNRRAEFLYPTSI